MPAPLNVCSACGVLAPRPGLPCEACGATERAHAPARAGALYFVRVRCQFQCRGCGRLAPLDGVDLSGTVRCVLCGLTQAFDPGAWPEALGHAHAIGDLAGGEGLHPHARWSIADQNPYRALGVDRALATITLAGDAVADGLHVSRALRLTAAPGHPLCASCHAPLVVEAASEGSVRTRCPGCGATGGYAVPAAVPGACKGLVGVVSDEHRAEQLREARAGDGVVALSCPSCGAPLPTKKGAGTVVCDFCHVACRLPARADDTVEDAEPVPFWLVFRGPSALRRQLELGRPEAGITTPPVRVPSAGARWLGRIPAAIVAGGVTVVSGVVLFVLMRMGFAA